MRIDVQVPTADVEAELERIELRLQAAGRPLRSMATLDLWMPGLVFRHREADGEHFVYAEEAASGRLAGCTVFNRLVELDRRADRVLRSPHSKYGRRYQRRGIASAVYRWALGQGICLLSGPRQSPGANALWHSLAKAHPLGYVSLEHKVLRYLGEEADDDRSGDLGTRMVLRAPGWDLERFLRETRAVNECEGAATVPGP